MVRSFYLKRFRSQGDPRIRKVLLHCSCSPWTTGTFHSVVVRDDVIVTDQLISDILFILDGKNVLKIPIWRWRVEGYQPLNYCCVEPHSLYIDVTLILYQ